VSRFKIGDRVRVVSVTNEDREPITDAAHPDAIDWTGTPLIGAVGLVTNVFADRLTRNNICLDHLVETVAFPDADLEPEA
jgi:hypothetical protein